MGIINVLDSTGHTAIVWDGDNAEDVKNARKTFQDLRDKGYRAFYVDETDRKKKGVRMDEFDPKAGTAIMIPQVRGG